MRRMLILMAAATTVAAAVLLGGAFGPEPTAPAAGTRTPAAPVSPTASTEAGVRELQAVVRRNPSDAAALTSLGLAYGQRFRETFDQAYLVRSEQALRRSRRLAPRDPRSLEGLGSIALARHDFAGALRFGRTALRLSPRSDVAHGIVGDALVELGRYEGAFHAFDRMAALEPSVASYARVSYGRELIGRPRAAVAALRLAVGAAGGRAEARAWSRAELGRLLFRLGRLDAAARSQRAALAEFPGYLPALDGLARVEAARGDLPQGISLARRAATAMPLPQYLGTLAELLRAQGREAEARRQDALVHAAARLLAAAGVRSDLEIAAYDADHGLRLPQALAAARRAHAERPSIDAEDTLAWALVRNGRCAEAVRHSRRALRLGTQDPVKLFHRGMAERCAGLPGAGRRWFRRALALNPAFSPLWAPVARRHAR